MNEKISRWKAIANLEPIILFEQGSFDLPDFLPEVSDIYIRAARKDPTSAARLIHHIVNRSYAPDVLATAFETFPSAASTYPQWRDLFQGKPDVINRLDEVIRKSQPKISDNGADNDAPERMLNEWAKRRTTPRSIASNVKPRAGRS